MKKLKISIVLISCIILSLIIVILNLNILQRQSFKENTVEEVENEIEMQTGEAGQKVTNATYNQIDALDYMNIEKCISGFLSMANRNSTAYFDNKGNKSTTDEEISDLILELLSENYITKNGISKNNINKYIYNINEDIFYIPTKVNKFYGDSTVNSFVVEGLIENQNYKNIMESKLILNIDLNNATYSIELLNNQQDIDKIKPQQINSIPKKDINTYENIAITEKEVIKEIVKLYKRTILGYPELFYNNYLNKEYSKNKFKNVNDFKKYIDKNKILIQQLNVEKYKIINNNNSKLYSLIDQYGNAFVIEYNSIIDYKIFLDNYTVDLDIFKENYEKADDSTKISMQIGKIKQMLNLKDYESIYSRLNTTFRNNNYKSVSELEKVLKENTYENNSIEIEESNEKDGYYVCECNIKNKQNETEEKKAIIVIKLIDSINFEFSFSFE